MLDGATQFDDGNLSGVWRLHLTGAVGPRRPLGPRSL